MRSLPGSGKQQNRQSWDEVENSCSTVTTFSSIVQLDYEDEPSTIKSSSVVNDWLSLIRNDSSERCLENSKIEHLLVTEGVPKKLRGRVWSWLVKRELAFKNNQTTFVPNISKTEFENLIRSETSALKPIFTQISFDISRTFPTHPLFSNKDSQGQLGLFNVLKAYAQIDPEVGYCQGMNFVVGVLLIHVSTDYEAFNLLLSLMFGFGLRSVYLPNIDGLHRCLYQLTRLMDTLQPEILGHLIINRMMPDLFATPWFLALFASHFPLAFVARVFDLIFFGNIEMLFRVIYSLLSITESLLVAEDNADLESVASFLMKTLPELSCSLIERVLSKVFSVDFSAELDCFAVEYGFYHGEEKRVQSKRIDDQKSALSPVESSTEETILNEIGSSSTPKFSTKSRDTKLLTTEIIG